MRDAQLTSNQGVQLLSDGQAFTDGGIDEIQKVSLRMSTVKTSSLGSVNHGTTTDSDKGIRVVLASEINGRLETGVGRLNTAGIIDDVVDLVLVQGLNHCLERMELGDLYLTVRKISRMRCKIELTVLSV